MSAESESCWIRRIADRQYGGFGGRCSLLRRVSGECTSSGELARLQKMEGESASICVNDLALGGSTQVACSNTLDITCLFELDAKIMSQRSNEAEKRARDFIILDMHIDLHHDCNSEAKLLFLDHHSHVGDMYLICRAHSALGLGDGLVASCSCPNTT